VHGRILVVPMVVPVLLSVHGDGDGGACKQRKAA
jgi:hypothetical protein